MLKPPSKRTSALLVSLLVILSSALYAQDASLVVYFPFDDDTGSEAIDLSSNANNGAIEGDPQQVEGIFGSALMFDATDDQVVVPGNPTLDIQDQITMAAWIRPGPNLTADWRTVMGKSPTSVLGQTTFSYDIRTDNTGILRFSLNIGGWQYILGPTLVEDTWYHVVGTYDGAELVLYLDGQAIGTAAASGQINVTADPFCVGNIVNAAGGSNNEYWSGIIDEVAMWNRALDEGEVTRIMTSGLQPAGPALAPDPGDGATDVPRDVILGWTAGPFAQTHDVYFGTAFDDVNGAARDNGLDVLLSQGQTAETYDAGRLAFGQTYYWRVDEVNAAPDNTVFKGDVWSFSVEPLAYPIANVIATSNGTSKEGEGPQNTVNGSGLNADDQHSTAIGDMWLATPTGAEPLNIQYEFDRVHKLHEMLIWNYNSAFELLLGFGLKGVTLEYSTDGAEWLALGDVEFAQGAAMDTYAASTTVDLEGVAAKYVRLTVNSGYGMMGQFGLSEVRFTSVPVQAREPQPADGAADVAVDADLSWRAGREAAIHEVSLGTDPNALVLVDSTSNPTLDPGPLNLAMTYYWQVHEVNEAEAISTWAGDLWSFSTVEFIVVDDFEDYDDEERRIFDVWIDGFINSTGSTVGYFEAPFAEQAIVHGGGQSMPLEYNNTGGITVSEATRTFDEPQDWTQNGVRGLLIWFYGDPTNDPAQMYIMIDNTKVPYDGDAENLTRTPWQLWYVDLAGRNVSSVDELTIGIEGSGQGFLLIDDILLSPHERQLVTPAEPDPANLVAHYAFDGDTSDSTGAHPGTPVG
ncbi:MAG: LamG domain-containing protein, partial [Planctomycetota bacterium]